MAGLLTFLAADPDLFDAYVDEFRERRDGLGQEGVLRLLKAPRPKVPWEQIREHGFADVGDVVLAYLATSPEALEALVGTDSAAKSPPVPGISRPSIA